jgi:pimeloyl-ACP methyl ester carboxylesterase
VSSVTNVVLVHGGFVDGSGWQPVYDLLKQDGYNVSVVQNPTLSLEGDADATRMILDRQNGPTVLVGHSYGGAVITNAGSGPKVAGLVYVAAFGPDEGETLASLGERNEAPPGLANIVPDAEGFLWIAHDKFHESFCQDLDETESLILATTQKPFAAPIFETPSGAPAWKTKPCWYQVSTQDRMISPDGQRFMAQRMDARDVLEVDAGHASMASQPKEIAGLILEAVRNL